MQRFYSLEGLSSGEYQEKGSRFLAYVFPCANEADFSVRLLEFKRAHLKARHHCFAWRFFEGMRFRAYDDGEPSGSAGLPIYNQLLSFELVDCALVVVRYFGGTLLGVPGLIRSYKSASIQALEAAKCVVFVPKSLFKVEVDYSKVNALLMLAGRYNTEVLEQEMAMVCRFVLACPRDLEEQFFKALKDLSGVVYAL